MEILLTAWWWVLVAVVALLASGLIQYGKGLWKTAPRALWAVLLPVLCVGIALLVQPWPLGLLLAGLGLVIAQLGYELLLQALLAWVRRTAGLDVQAPAPAAPIAPGPPG